MDWFVEWLVDFQMWWWRGVEVGLGRAMFCPWSVLDDTWLNHPTRDPVHDCGCVLPDLWCLFKSGNICLSGQHFGDMSATFPAKSIYPQIKLLILPIQWLKHNGNIMSMCEANEEFIKKYDIGCMELGPVGRVMILGGTHLRVFEHVHSTWLVEMALR